MSAGDRVSLLEAATVAEQLVSVLRIGAERIEVAGSIRRKRPDVGDIEIVAVPRLHVERLREGLFEDRDVTVDEFQVVIDTLILDGTLGPHPDDPKRGPRYSKLIHRDSGVQVDIFSATAEQFGMALVIRTGPASYSQWLVNEARARHFHVAKGYEIHPSSFSCGAVACKPIPTFTEDDVFRVLQIHPLSPEARG